MADPARIIMAGLAMQKDVVTQTTALKVANRERMRAALRQSGVDVERAIAAKKQEEAEEDIAKVSKTYGYLAATGQLDKAPGVLNSLELKTPKGQAFAGDMLLDVPGRKFAKDQREFTQKKQEIALEGAELALETDKAAVATADSQKRIKAAGARASTFVTQRMAQEGRDFRSMVGDIRDLVLNGSDYAHLTRDEKFEVIANVQAHSAAMHQFAVAGQDEEWLNALSNDIAEWAAANDKDLLDPSQYDAEARQSLYAFLKAKHGEKEARRVQELIEEEEAQAIARGFKEREITVKEDAVKAARSAATAKATAAKDAAAAKAAKIQQEFVGTLDGEIAASSIMSDAIALTINSPDGGTDLAGEGGLTTLRSQAFERLKAVAIQLTESGAPVDYVNKFVETGGAAITRSMEDDMWLQTIQQFSNGTFVNKVLTTPVLTWTDSKDQTYSGEPSTWPKEASDEFVRHSIAASLGARQQGTQLVQAFSSGLTLASGVSVQASGLPAVDVLFRQSQKQASRVGVSGVGDLAGIVANTASEAQRLGIDTPVADPDRPQGDGGGDDVDATDETREPFTPPDTGVSRAMGKAGDAISAVAKEEWPGIKRTLGNMWKSLERVADIPDRLADDLFNVPPSHELAAARDLAERYAANEFDDVEYERLLRLQAPILMSIADGTYEESPEGSPEEPSKSGMFSGLKRTFDANFIAPFKKRD